MAKAVRTSNDSSAELTIILPIFNEAESLPLFLPELVASSEANGWNLIFVNDASLDSSGEILSGYAEKNFVTIIHHKVNRGYGGALKTGIARTSTSYLLTMDGDGQHNITDAGNIFEFALRHHADMVVGRRTNLGESGLLRSAGKWLIRQFARFLFPIPVHDLNSGFKLYRTELAQRYLNICPDSMAFSDVMTLAFISGHNLVIEFPIEVKKRVGGKSTIGLQTAAETLIEILNLVMLFNPLRVFLPLSVICVLAGVGWGLPIVISGRGVSVGAMLAIILGVLCFVLGLLASQLSAIRINILDLGQRKETEDDGSDPTKY
jgi:glycosyltransferase involved in cell wall biosynthesis